MTAEETPVPVQARGAEPFFESVAADLDRMYIYFEGSGPLRKLGVYFTTQALWALVTYRFGRALKTRRLPVVGPMFWPMFRVMEFLARAMTGIILDVDARIGPGFYIGHFGSICVGPGVVIGRNCSLGQTGVVSGDGSWPDTPAPVVGDRVSMAVGTKIIGPVTVGDDVAFGANAVVVTDIPPNATAVGNPATVINYNGSAKYIRLRTE